MNCKYIRCHGAVLMSFVCIVTFFVNNSVLVPDIMESRNIIAAREMVYDGHWLVPTMNGNLRLEKPPLPTWLTAVAEIAVPDSLAAQRGMAGLAAVLLVFYFWMFARKVLEVPPLVPSLLLCTCYNVILMGRTASWDIYCHAFMMGGIYHTARALAARRRVWGHFMAAGIYAGLSAMSKGPVSLYALYLPFLIAFFTVYRPSARGKAMAAATAAFVALAIGLWWYVYVRLYAGDALMAVVRKESGSWIAHNVRPWWYYHGFYLETGVWSLLLLTSLFLPLKDKSRRGDSRWLFAVVWMLCSLVLLSLLPEKKTRYLLPLLIPASYAMGCMIGWWRQAFGAAGIHSVADRLCFRINAVVPAVVVALLPVAAVWFVYRPGYLPVWGMAVLALLSLAVSACMIYAAVRLRPSGLVSAVTAMFIVAECLAMPVVMKLVNNPDMRSIAATRNVPELACVPFYHPACVPLRIELVYAAHRKILPVPVDSLPYKLPCAVLTHRRVGETLPAILWAVADTVYMGCYDDNRRPKGTRRYSGDFIYHVTLLKPKASMAGGSGKRR